MDENPTLPTLTFSEGEGASSEAEIEKWNDLNLVFNSSATPIEISVTVENLSTECWLLVDIIEGLDNGKSDNINKEVQKENLDYTLGESHVLVPSTGDGTSKVEFTINLTVSDPNCSTETIFSYIINLNNSNEEPPEPAKELDFTFSGNKVTGYTGNETNITIPTSYSMEKTPYNSFVLTAEEFEQPTPTPELLNKMAMLYVLKNYTVYLNGQSEGVFCENGVIDFAIFMENLTDPAVFPLRVELPEDLTFELTEEEMGGGQKPEETEFKFEALEILQNFYVQFGENSEEILCQNYDDFVSKLREIMPEGPKPEYFPLKFRIDYASYKYFEGDDYKVEAIGNFSLTPSTSEPVVLTIPSAISIDPLAFSAITHEFSIVFEEGRTEIPNQTFMNCGALKGIVFPNSMQKIGERAFYGCTGITELTIQNSVKEIDPTAFNGCTGVVKLNYNANLQIKTTEISTSSYFSSNFGSPEGYELVIGPDVEEIYTGLFSNNTNLIKVAFNSEKLSYVGGGAFYGCTNLQTNSYEGGIYLGKGTNPYYLLLTVEDKTVENFVIAETCEIIGGGEVLAGCTNLKSIVIPNSVTSICGEAFHNCSSLQTVTINPESELKVIGPIAFKDCAELTSIYLPSKLTTIGIGAFEECVALKSITIPASVETIENSYEFDLTKIFSSPGEIISWELISGANPFRLTNIEQIIVEEGNKYYKSIDNKVLLSIDEKIIYSFAGGSSLESYTIPNTVEIVGAGAFSFAKNLKTIIVPYGVNTIGSSAFAGSGITSITIPSSVNSIGVGAFGECKSLNSVFFEEGTNIQNIYGYSFYRCGSLKEISLPNTIKTIGEYAFANCQAIDTLIFEKDIVFGRLAFDESKATTVILGSELTKIPDIFGPSDLQALNIVIEENSKITTIEYERFQNITELKTFIVKENSSLTTIESYAFDGCSSLTSVSLPSTLTSIGANAFQGCSSLTEITILEGVVEIGERAFQGCSSLTSITIPEGVKAIGQSAFRDCAKLSSVSLPSTLTSIGSYAFSYCSSLEVFNGDGNEYYTIDDNRALLVDGGKTLLAYAVANTATSYTIPESVTSIGDYAFDGCSSLTSVTIPEGVKEISGYVFRDCSSLTSVSLPKTLTSIGNSAFDGCSNLTSISIPGGVVEIGDYAFDGCSSLTEITIPEGVTEISGYVFRDCSSLTSITIPEGVTSIDWYAFYGCSNLTSVSLPSTLDSIGSYAFNYCYALAIVYNPSKLNILAGYSYHGFVGYFAKEIVTSGNNSKGRIETEGNVQYYVNEETGKEIALAPSVPRDSLTSITIRKGTTEINKRAFRGCSGLTSITIPEGVTLIGEDAFQGCSGLTSITIPEGVTLIGESAFQGCSSLTSITISEGVTLIYDFAFYGCSGITSITIPEGVKAIGQSVFRDCAKLSSVSLPSTLTSIGESAFRDCISLTSITIPVRVTEISEFAFFGCYALAIVYNNSNLKITAGSTENGYVGYYAKEIVKKGGTSQGKIEIDGGVQYYVNGITIIALAPSVARGSLTSVTIREGTTEIGDGAFMNCSSLTSITLPNTLTSIGNRAFYYCEDLTSITIPEGVTSIGDYAFAECSSLTSVSLPSTLTSIGDSAFWVCSSLTTITIPKGVTSIGGSAFSSCIKLTSITINGNITSLGTRAFFSCSKLTSLTLGEGVTSLPDGLFGTNNLTSLTEIEVLGDLRSETFPSGTWYKGEVEVTSFDGEGVYTRTDI